jgi:hypothetical protein
MGTSGMRTIMMMLLLLLILLLCTITVGIQNVAAVRGNGDEVSLSCFFFFST